MSLYVIDYLDCVAFKMAIATRNQEGIPSSYDPDAFDSMCTINSELWNEGGSDEAGEEVNWSEDLLKEDNVAVSGPAFLSLAQAGNFELVRRMYESLGDELIRYKDEDGYSALHRACYNGHLGVAEYLLAAGADARSRSQDGWQPLHSACRWNKVGVASLLLQNGALINAATNGGQTALHLAAANSQAAQTLELLLTHPDVDPGLVNDVGETACEIAAKNGPHVHLFELVDPALRVT